ncbi:MAG: hypothetical protein ACYS1A_19865 [Planctomycetota bacterium]|jgi:hypothetical protein
MVITIIALAILVLLFTAANNEPKPKPADKAVIAAQKLRENNERQTVSNLQIKLNEIEKQISGLSQNKTAQTQREQISGLAQSIAKIINSTAVAQKTSQQNAKALQKNYQDLTARINNLTAKIAQLSKQLTPVKYLSANTLPFKVAGIDFWNNRPMVSIAMKDPAGVIHYRLIGEGMAAEGWRIRSLNSNTKTLIFINSKNQKVKTEL